MKKHLIAFALTLFVLGCQNLYDTAVTITQIDDAAMKDWATESKAGRTSPKIDAQVMLAQAKFKAACDVTADALETYKKTGDSSSYVAALSAARIAVGEILNLLYPIIPTKVGDLQSGLQKAHKL